MAVLPDCPGLTVEVIVDGEPLREYDNDEAENPKSITKYIEAASGAHFQVQCTIDSAFPLKYGLKWCMYLDGKNMYNPCLSKKDLAGELPYVSVVSGAATYEMGASYISKFQFAESQVAEESGRNIGKQEQTSAASVGQIRVSFYHVKNVRPMQAPNSWKGNQLGSNLGPVHEKQIMKNALSHYGSLGPAERSSVAHVSCEYVGDKNDPFATFNFNYRSLASLKVLCIVPRTPSPVPLEQRPAGELSHADILALQQLVMQRNGSIKPEPQVKNEIKRERNGDDDDDEVTFVTAKRQKEDRRQLPKPNQEVIELDWDPTHRNGEGPAIRLALPLQQC